MCGICGFTGYSLPNVLKRMSDRLFHRGPDSAGFLELDKIQMAMRRLSIVDITGGEQPMSNEDESLWIVCNGEIYNHLELRHELEKSGHSFRSDHSDVETILHLYEEYGTDWPKKVNGMFGAVIWDVRKEQLLLFRDRMGKKPLFYANTTDCLVFGSEVKALLAHPKVSADNDFSALYNYFGLKNLSAPQTAYKQIKQILPGHFLIWHSGQIILKSWWNTCFTPLDTPPSETEAAECLLSILNDAVKLRMRCDVPYGAYLSGGVDSSAVVALMSQQASSPIKTFCLGYEDESTGQFIGKREDLLYARQIAERFATEHYEYIMSANQFASGITEALYHFDEPFSGSISTMFLSKLMSRHIKVAISGDGADELFGSYLAHRLAWPVEKYLHYYDEGKTAWSMLSTEEKAALIPYNNQQQFEFIAGIADRNTSVWRSRLSVFTAQERRNLLTDEFYDNVDCIAGDYGFSASNLSAVDELNKNLEIDQREFLANHILPLSDRFTMSHSIEMRSPYLDFRYVEYANRLPGNYKINNGISKKIHKLSVSGILPPDLINRPKEGFIQPIYSWMHKQLKPLIMAELNGLPCRWFKKEMLNSLIRRFNDGDTTLNAKVWNLVCFSIWARQTGF